MERSSLGSARLRDAGADLPAGTRLGEYAIERVLGTGGMGTVYAAWHPVLRSRAAIKVLNLDVSHNAAMVERFVSEAQAASRISHPNIIKIFGFGELPDGRKYFVMEYLEGESMTAWLARGRPEAGEALDLLTQVCEALEAAHRDGIVHRDLKPDNLWIARPRHGRPYIKILDFGIAKAAEGPAGKSNTKTGSLLGTPQFMSPEQCTGRGVDHRTDIYAMGGILYCVYCGRPPFERESPAELVAAHLYATVPMPSVFANVPITLERLILSCLEKDPDKRPQTAAELALRLRAAVDAAVFEEEEPRGVPAPEARPALRATERFRVPTEVDRLDAAPAIVELETPPARRLDEAPRWRRRRWPMLVAAAVAAAGLGGWLAWRGDLFRGARAPEVVAPSPRRPAPQTAPLLDEPFVSPTAPAAKASSPPVVVPEGRPSRAPTKARPRPTRPAARTADPPPASRPTLPSPEPSRTVREGLIEENPFR